jgi:hypothetical protein
MESVSLKIITEDEFYKKFTLQANYIDTNAGFNGCMFETFGEELEYVFEMNKLNRVVTIIEGDLDEDDEYKTLIDDLGNEVTEPKPNLYYASGFHYINRLGYFVLDKQYEYEFEVKVE